MVDSCLARRERSAGGESAGADLQYSEVGHRGETHGGHPGDRRAREGVGRRVATENGSERIVGIDAGQEAAARVGVDVDSGCSAHRIATSHSISTGISKGSSARPTALRA